MRIGVPVAEPRRDDLTEMTSTNPFEPFLALRGFAFLDGGLATELEARGHVLDSRLWSADLLRSHPDAVEAVHRAYLAAGADCITTASYQASVPGFLDAGVSRKEAVELLMRSSEIALRARDRHVAEGAGEGPTPLVAASIGPYGAYLADGSEYDGRYGIPASKLRRFHADRLSLLASSGVDLLACETIPSGAEAEVLLDILEGRDGDIGAWMSFSCRDGGNLHDGTPIEEVVAMCEGSARIAAVGVNCTPPRFVPGLVARAAAETELPLMAYPNSGERYDASTGHWRPAPSGGPVARSVEEAAGFEGVGSPSSVPEPWLTSVLEARRAGATILGGCCRVGPDAIGVLRQTIVGRD